MIGAFALTHWRWLAGIAGALVMAGLLFWVHQDGVDAGRAEVQARWNAEKAGASDARAQMTAALGDAISGLDTTLQHTVTSLHTQAQDLTIHVTKDMADDPRYTNPACALTDSVRAQVDAARGLSRPATVARVSDGGMSTSGAAVRLDLGQPGAVGH